MTIIVLLLLFVFLAILFGPVIGEVAREFQRSRMNSRLRRREFELRRQAHAAKTEIRRIVRDRMRQMLDP